MKQFLIVLIFTIVATATFAQTTGKFFSELPTMSTVDNSTFFVTLDGTPKVWKKFGANTLRSYVNPTVTSIANATAISTISNPYEGDLALNTNRDTLWIRATSTWIIFKAGTGGSGGSTPSLQSVLSVGNSANSLKITNLATPTAFTDASTKGYVDTQISGVSDAANTYSITVSRLTVRDSNALLKPRLLPISPSANSTPVYNGSAWANQTYYGAECQLATAKPSPLTTKTANVVIDTTGSIDSFWVWNTSKYILFQAGGVTDGNKGVITVSNNGQTWVLNNASVASANIVIGGVTSSNVLDGTIVKADISSNTLDSTLIAKISPNNIAQNGATAGQALVWDNVKGAYAPRTVSGGSGTVTNVSGASANGFSVSIANPTTTPAITVGTTITGVLKGNGTAISAATAGTDYVATSDSRLSDTRTPPDNTVSTAKIVDGAVTSAKIGTATITSTNISGGAILGTNIAGQTIVNGNIVINTIDSTRLAPRSINTSELVDGSVTTAKLATTGVTGGYYTSANITVDATGRITGAANGSGGGSGITALTGDVTASGTGSVAATISNGAVTGVKIATGTIASSNILNGTIDAVDIATDAISTIKIQNAAVDSTKAGNLSLSNINTSSGSVGQVPTITASGLKFRTPASGGGSGSLPTGVYNNAIKYDGVAYKSAPDGTINPSVFRFYAASAGSNSNAGTDVTTPKKTIASFSGSFSNGLGLGLNAGDQFREEIIPENNKNSFGVSYNNLNNTNKYATVNGSNVVKGWTASGAHYDKSVTHEITSIVINAGYDGLIVAEIDTFLEKYYPLAAINYLRYRSSTVSVDSFAGSYSYTNATPTSVVSIRPTAGVPGSNKYRYEVSIRRAAIRGYLKDSMNVSNLWLKSSGDGYGPLELGDNFTAKNLILTGGTTHQAVVKSGLMDNVLFGRTSVGFPAGHIPIAFYEANASGNVSTLSNSIFYKLPTGVIAHTSGGGNHRKITLNNVYFFGDSITYPTKIMFSVDQTDTTIINRAYVDNCGGFGATSSAYYLVSNSVFNNISKPNFLFNSPTDVTRYAEIINCFWKSYGTVANQSATSTGAAHLLYKPNAGTTVRVENCILHGKTSSAINLLVLKQVTVANKNIVICDAPNGAVVLGDNFNYSMTGSNNNVYIKVAGNFFWQCNPALNSGSPTISSLATWQAVTGYDANSVFIDVSNNPLGLRAIFVDPDAGNYTLVPNGQYTTQILATGAGMITPITKFIPATTEDECADLVMNNKVPTLLQWSSSASGGSGYNIRNNFVSYSKSFASNRIPYTNGTTTVNDTTLLTYSPSAGLFVKGNSNSTGKAFEVQNSDATSLFSVNNNSDVSIGRASNSANTTAIVNLIATDGSNTTTNPGIRLHSNQNGSVYPPNLTWSQYISGTYKDLLQIRAGQTSYRMISPMNGAIFMLGQSLDQTTAVTNTLVNDPVRYPYVDFPQMTYIDGGELALGRDLNAGSVPGNGILRSGQKNTVQGSDVNASVLTIQAGRGNGAQTANTGEIRFQTPDGVATGQLQTYSTKVVFKNDGKVGIGTTAPTSNFQVSGSQGGAILSISANITLDATHNTVIIPNGSAFTVTLPSAAGITGRQYRIVNKVSGSITVGNYINLLGATVSTIGTGTSIFVMSDGTNWQQIQ